MAWAPRPSSSRWTGHWKDHSGDPNHISRTRSPESSYTRARTPTVATVGLDCSGQRSSASAYRPRAEQCQRELGTSSPTVGGFVVRRHRHAVLSRSSPRTSISINATEALRCSSSPRCATARTRCTMRWGLDPATARSKALVASSTSRLTTTAPTGACWNTGFEGLSRAVRGFRLRRRPLFRSTVVASGLVEGPGHHHAGCFLLRARAPVGS